MKKFRIVMVCDVTLDESQIWPDGDAPKSAHAGDVYDLIIQETKARPWDASSVPKAHRIIDEWNLGDDLRFRVEEVE